VVLDGVEPSRGQDAGLPEGSRPDLVRFITHLDVSASDIEEAGRRLALALNS
jgi:threonine aldolase